MTKNGWKKLILSCRNNEKQLDLLSELLEQVDLSKQILIDKGYSCTRMSLLETVKSLSEYKKSYKIEQKSSKDLYDDRFDEFS